MKLPPWLSFWGPQLSKVMHVDYFSNQILMSSHAISCIASKYTWYISIIQWYIQDRFHVWCAYTHIYLLNPDVKNNHKYTRFRFAKFPSVSPWRQCYDECLLNHLSRLLSRTCQEYCSIRHCILQGVFPEYFSRIRNRTSVGPVTESVHKIMAQTPLRAQQTSILTPTPTHLW